MDKNLMEVKNHLELGNQPVDDMPEPEPEFAPDDKIVRMTNERTVVAVVGWAHDWAAYAATSDWSITECARHGDKISESEARNLFPQLKDWYYRA
jgi:hypothetical protein